MPLTKSDLTQIGNLIGRKLDTKLDEKLSPIKKDLKVVKKDIGYLKRTVDIIAKNYDEGDVKLERRVSKIEKHLSLPAGN